MDSKEKSGNNETKSEENDWFSSELATLLLEEEKNRCSKYLMKLFGYHLLQLDELGHPELLESSSISHKILMGFKSESQSASNASLISDQEFLAIASDSMDVVVLPHVMEFSDNPHKLLREVERILIGEGHLLMIGFNPWSFWGMWRLLLFWRENRPWKGHFYRPARIKDWLSLLDFELLENEYFFYRPPLKNIRWMDRIFFLESFGKHCWPFLGGAYVILAKKRVVPLTPMKMRWHARWKIIASGLVEPGASV
ncbi:MAG: methyltransferase domain-containing protein [Gammaproteobacteria bacterium]|nr:methyltransferase domain-containing protein [Gammaproteobacteria bacterium]